MVSNRPFAPPLICLSPVTSAGTTPKEVTPQKYCTGFQEKFASRGLHRRVILREVPQGAAQLIVKSPYFTELFW